MKKPINTIGTIDATAGKYVLMADNNIIEPKKAKNTL